MSNFREKKTFQKPPKNLQVKVFYIPKQFFSAIIGSCHLCNLTLIYIHWDIFDAEIWTKNIKNAPKMGGDPLSDPQYFFQKLSSVTFVPLCFPYFMQNKTSIQWTLGSPSLPQQKEKNYWSKMIFEKKG